MVRRPPILIAGCSIAVAAAAALASPASIDDARAAYPETAPSAGQLCRQSDRGVVTRAANGDTVRCTAEGSRSRWKVVGSAPAAPARPSQPDRDREGDADRERARLGRQLLINQRISQATILRANAIEDTLNAGLEAADIRDGALTLDAFSPTVTFAGVEGSVDPPANPRRRIQVPPLSSFSRTSLTPSAAQLRTNQRIAQAAVRRANALAARLSGDLTGGDIDEFAITPAKLAPGLQVVSFQDVPRPAPSVTVIAPAGSGGGTVRLNDAQLRINQRISQAAIRRLNNLRDQIETGLTAQAFSDGTIVGANLAR